MRRSLYAALPLGWAVLVLVLTLTPAAEMPLTPVWELLSFDTAAHAGVFAVLAGLSWLALRQQRRWPGLGPYLGRIVLAGSVLFGGLIEVLQMTMHLGRRGEWSDLLSDALGAALAVGVATAWAARRPPRLSVCGLGLLGALTAGGAGSGPVRAQDLPRVRRTIAKLAAPGLHGRGYVRRGEHRAAAYLRGRLRQLGLEPLAPDYSQPFTLDVNTFPDKLALAFDFDVARLPGSDLRCVMRPGQDFIAAPESGGGGSGRSPLVGPLVMLDTLIFSDSLAQRRQLHQALGGGLLLRARDAQRLPTLPPALQQHLDSAAVSITIVPKLTASLAAEQGRSVRLLITEAAWQRACAGQTAMPRVSFRVTAALRRSYPTQNLAALVRGTAQPDSFLVVSAHYDHLGMMGRRVYFPGANDNASGVALLLELAAHYARPENRPACSVVFLLFGAEEAGLLGSRYFVARPLIPLRRIRFLVNLDLLGTGEQGATVVNGRLLPGPYQRLVALNAAHHYLPALAPRGRAANSDHFPFFEAGVPAFFLYTRGGSASYHDVNDQPGALSLAGFAGAFGLVRDFLNELDAAR